MATIGSVKQPAFQVILLGAGGGPIEDNVTGLLVRSTSTNWAKGSVLAIDAGTHLAAVVKIISEHLPQAKVRGSFDKSHGDLRPLSSCGSLQTQLNGHDTERRSRENPSPKLFLTSGPFEGFELPYTTAQANAAHFVRNLITTYLITHPHLDHISGFVINTAGFQHTSRPKRLAGLPSTIDAFKAHIFNDVIWPNLSDEDGGVGLVSYMRLAEGGNLAIGEGEGRGYIEVCDGLAVKSWSVSHGKCIRIRGKYGNEYVRSQEAFDENLSRRPSQNIVTPTSIQRSSICGPCVTDSSAFFLRDDHTGTEVLFFGDVEPDSLSLDPRTAQVWDDAAPKIVRGSLKGIFIECSYDESQSDDTLFGHLSPRHIIQELQTLAEKVSACQKSDLSSRTSHKREARRISHSPNHEPEKRPGRNGRLSTSSNRKTRKLNSSPSAVPALKKDNGSTVEAQLPESHPQEKYIKPLTGLQVIVIHIKDNLRDGPQANDIILEQLLEKEKESQLGCSFVVSKPGSSVWL